MKKAFLNFMAIVVAISLVMVSCDEKLNEPPTRNTEPSEPNPLEGYTMANYAEARNYSEFGYIDVYLYNETDSLVLSLSTEEKALSSIPEGEYTIDQEQSYEPFTWDPEYTYHWVGEGSEFIYLTEGKVNVTKKGRIYTITTDCVDESGDTVKFAYQGLIELMEEEEELDPYFGEPEEATENTLEIAEIEAGFYGDVFGIGANNYWCYMSNEDGTVEMILDLFADGESTADTLPAGTYSVLNAENASTTTGYFIYPGEFNWEAALATGKLIDGLTTGGTFILLGDENTYSNFYYVVDGSLEVAEADGGNYTISGTLTTIYGSTWTISYTGGLLIEDSTSQGAPAKAKSIAVKNTFNSKKINKKAFRRR